MENKSLNSERPADGRSSRFYSRQDDLPKHDRDSAVPKSIAFFPPEILEKLFSYLPVKDLICCAGVCRSWRTELVKTSSNWRDVKMGRNANCFANFEDFDEFVAALQPHAVDFLPLRHVEEVVFKAAVPFVTKEWNKEFGMHGDGEAQEFATDSTEYQITELPLARLGVILNYASRLRRLDLSAMWLEAEMVAAFRYKRALV